MSKRGNSHNRADSIITNPYQPIVSDAHLLNPWYVSIRVIPRQAVGLELKDMLRRETGWKRLPRNHFLPPGARGTHGMGNLLAKLIFPIFNINQRTEPPISGSIRQGPAPLGPVKLPQNLLIIFIACNEILAAGDTGNTGEKKREDRKIGRWEKEGSEPGFIGLEDYHDFPKPGNKIFLRLFFVSFVSFCGGFIGIFIKIKGGKKYD